MWRLPANIALFQAGWLGCVLGRQSVWALVVVAVLVLHGVLLAKGGREWLSILICGSIGIATDSILMHMGILHFEEAGMLCPFWLAGLWFVFATMLNHALAWMQHRVFWAALFGALGGPASYYAGSRLGAVALTNSPWLSLQALAIVWAALMPLFFSICRFLKVVSGARPSASNAAPGFESEDKGKISSLLALCLLFAGHPGNVARADSSITNRPTQEILTCELLCRPGGNVDWSHKRNLLALDRIGSDGYYDLFVMRPDGTGLRCLSCEHPDLPGRNMGQPAWSPDGEYLLFQVQKKNHPRTAFGFVAQPTAGVFCDLWVLRYDTAVVAPLHTVPEGKDHGSLRPVFSLDGKTLYWSQMYDRPSILTTGKEVGYWKLFKADFVTDAPMPELRNIREIETPRPAFYEVHAAMPNNSSLLVCSNHYRQEKPVFYSTDISLLDLRTGSMRRLTQTGYNEHAFPTPDGKRIVWAHALEVAEDGADYWIMNADGSDKKRLSFFNEPSHLQYNGKPFVAADFSWSPDGTKFAAYCHDGWQRFQKVNERILMATLDPSIR